MTNALSLVPDQRLFWDEWHKRHREASHGDHAAAALKIFVDALPARARLRILELGCGQGREAISMAREGMDVYAFDHSSVAISAALSTAAEEGLSAKFFKHNMTHSIPFPPRTFDGAFAHLSLHYFNDATTKLIFRELGRVLTPGGILFFTVRSTRDILYGKGISIGENIFCLNGHVRHFFSAHYIRQTLAGWDLRLVEYYDTSEQTVNPGVFIKALAARPDTLI